MEQIISMINQWLPTVLSCLTTIGAILAVFAKIKEFSGVPELIKLINKLSTKLANQNNTIASLEETVKKLERRSRGIKDDEKNK